MPTLTPDQYPQAQALFGRLGEFHLCAKALLAGMSPGEVWVDDVDHPTVGFAESAEGAYLAGDPQAAHAYAELKEVIPYMSYLICDPLAWEQVLPEVWANRVARRHPRLYFVFRETTAPSWRDRLPDGFRLLPIDADFFQHEHLASFEPIASWLEGWKSREDFLERGAGSAILQGDTIASWSLMDCACEDRCEIGVHTALPFRKMGLGRLVVSATLEACLARGYRQVGWQCLTSNAGSQAIARRVGFVQEREYVAFGTYMPAESTGDLNAVEYEDWACHYERFMNEQHWCGFLAVEARSMAGQPLKALENLRFLRQVGWKAKPEWVESNLLLKSVKELPEARELLVELTAGA